MTKKELKEKYLKITKQYKNIYELDNHDLVEEVLELSNLIGEYLNGEDDND